MAAAAHSIVNPSSTPALATARRQSSLRPRFRHGADAAVLSIVASEPLGYCFVALLGAIPCILCLAAQEHYPVFFWLITIGLLLVGAAYGWETVSLLPVWRHWKPTRKHFSAAHDRRVNVECRTHPFNMHAPVVVRRFLLRLCCAGAPLAIIIGIVDLSANMKLNDAVGAGVVLYVLMMIVWTALRLYKWASRVMMAPLAEKYAAEASKASRAGGGGADLRASDSSAGASVSAPLRAAASTRKRPQHALLRVMQLNLNGCVGADGKFDIQRAATVIVRSGAHVVALQEVERCVKVGRRGEQLALQRSQVDTLHKLAEITGMHVRFSSKTAAFGGQFGNAVLSRVPIMQSASHQFLSWNTHSSDVDGPPLQQGCMAVRVVPPRFRHPVWVVTTQLGADRTGVEQLFEMAELVRFLRALGGAVTHKTTPAPRNGEHRDSTAAALEPRATGAIPGNIIVCGDFHAPDDAPAMRYAEACGIVDVSQVRGGAPEGSMGLGAMTYPSDRPSQPFDRVLAMRDSPSVAMQRVDVVHDGASTHCPVCVDFLDVTPAIAEAV